MANQHIKDKESGNESKDGANDESEPYQDHGIAWLSVIAVFINNLTMGGTFKSFGVIYVGLIELYGAGEFTTSLASIVNTVVTCICCLITGYLADKISIRWTVIFGAVLSLAGFTLSAFGPNIYYTIIGYGVITGIGASCFDSPLFTAIALYWNKRKSLANGVAFSGTSLGTLIFPLIYTALIKEYTVRGALLFAGAFWFHLCIAGMLVRRPPPAKKRINIKKIDSSFKDTEDNSKEIILLPKNLLRVKEATDPYYLVDSLERCPKYNENVGHCKEIRDMHHINSLFTSQKIKHDPAKMRCDGLEQNDRHDDVIKETTSGTTVINIGYQIAEGQLKCDDRKTEQKEMTCGNVLGFKSLLTNILFLRHLLMTCLGTAASFGILFLLPSLAKEWGADDFVSSLTVTVTGASEILARLVSGYCIDKFHINKVWFWSAAHVVCAVSAIIIASTKTVYAVMILAVLLGVTGTILVPLLMPIVSDYVPSGQTGKASGMVVCVFNVGAAIGYAIVGEASQRSGTYVSPLLIFSGIFVFVSTTGFLDIFYLLVKSRFCFCNKRTFHLSKT